MEIWRSLHVRLMTPAASSVRHYVTFKYIGDKTAFFSEKELLYKSVEAYLSIKSTRPVILNSSRQAQNILPLLLWLFLGASKNYCVGLELSPACGCADQESPFLSAQPINVKHMSGTRSRESARFAGVSRRKSGYGAERQRSSTDPWREVWEARRTTARQTAGMGMRVASCFVMRRNRRYCKTPCQINSKVRYDNIILMFPKKIWLSLKCLKSNKLIGGKAVRGKHTVMDLSALTMVKISSSRLGRNLQCCYTRGWIVQLIFLLSVTRQWQRQTKDIC